MFHIKIHGMKFHCKFLPSTIATNLHLTRKELKTITKMWRILQTIFK
jgi:hypothetical protein